MYLLFHLHDSCVYYFEHTPSQFIINDWRDWRQFNMSLARNEECLISRRESFLSLPEAHVWVMTRDHGVWCNVMLFGHFDRWLPSISHNVNHRRLCNYDARLPAALDRLDVVFTCKYIYLRSSNYSLIQFFILLLTTYIVIFRSENNVLEKY